jgi:tRNA-2-methylthio-N6-dimethylallyladenosine synthase
MNRVDSERIAAFFDAAGFKMVSEISKADIVVVNMCSVRQMAADRVFGLAEKFRTIKKKDKRFRSILTGCIVEKDKPKFKQIFDHIFGITDLDLWLEAIKSDRTKRAKKDYLDFEPARSRAYSASIPISTGCDNFCSYCVVPYTRGRLVPRDSDKIAAEAEKAVLSGAKEIWLLGQNVNNYRWIKKNGQVVDFAGLLRLIDAIPGDFWIRFTSPHPKDFSDSAVEAVASCLKVTPYFNLPVQAGDDKILKAMARPYTAAQYVKLVGKIRKAFKIHRQGLEAEVALSTDVIVGFPGETKKQFLSTVGLFKKIKFDMAYIAQYSPRPGTAAAKLKDNVKPREKKRRLNALTKILFETSAANNKIYAGKNVAALVDKAAKNDDGSWIISGKTRSYKTVRFGSKKFMKPGTMVTVKIIKALPLGLKAELVR